MTEETSPGGLGRRSFLALGAVATGAVLVPVTPALAGRTVRASGSVFKMGIASGDPLPDSVILWTRLAPQPLELDGGMGKASATVEWEIATDEAFTQGRQSGTYEATETYGHSVHIDVKGLTPDTWYYYRFKHGSELSPVGRTRTTPELGASMSRLVVGQTSCANWQSGYYQLYADLAAQEPDYWLALGDYIYEYGNKGYLRESQNGKPTRPIPWDKETYTIWQYRRQYGLYRSSPELQALHAAAPYSVTWDDHEVDNNYAAAISEEVDVDPAAFLVRRAAAYQAYYEMMPLRRACLPRGPHMRLHRDATFGDLAGFFVLDTRQYRGDQPNGDGKQELDDAAFAPGRPMLGDAQEAWLLERLTGSSARWNILAQQVMFGMVDRTPGDRRLYAMDQWPGYLDARRRLLEAMHERRVANPVVLTGDIHSNWVNDLRADDRRPELPVLATEFVGTGISSTPNGITNPAKRDQLLAENPSLVWHGGGNGYASCLATRDRLETTYVLVEDVTRPDSAVNPSTTFVVESGRPGAVRT
jgi:alkaline phosphatase D